MRFPLLGRWEDAETGEVLVERLLVAQTFLQRLRGLQFARPLEPDCGLLLRHCRSVHTMWMRFAIDVVFLNAEFEIQEIRTGTLPWRFVIPRAPHAAHVVELTAGCSQRLFVGQKTRTALTTYSEVVARELVQ